MSTCPTLEKCIGNTPLVRLQRLCPTTRNNVILAKLEGNNPAGSVKDRPALSMVNHGEERGMIKPGDTLIEATSGNTGIALAMIGALKGYQVKLVMPENASVERRNAMRAYGAEIILVDEAGGMEAARDLAQKMQDAGEGIQLNQFSNADNPLAHYESTGREIWRDTEGRVTHFVSAMGTTGTIMGTSCYLKRQNPQVEIIGVQPDGESRIPGIRRWPPAYLPKIFNPERVDRIIDVNEADARATTRALARQEGILAGPSSGGALWAALQIEQEVHDAVIVTIICDRGDRYLSTDVFA